MWDTILAVIQPAMTGLGTFVAAGGGLGAIVYTIFKVFSEKWLNAKFEERLAAYKHAQQKELEQLRFAINALMDRTVKFHQKEFDIIPEAWGLLNDAFNNVLSVTHPYQSYPDVSKLTSDQLADLFAKSPFSDFEKNELQAAHDKKWLYIKFIKVHKFEESREIFNKFHEYFSRNSIFMPESIRDKFATCATILSDDPYRV